MTKRDLDAVVNAARSDRAFLRKCILNFEEALREKGFNLTEDEMSSAQGELERLYKEVLAETRSGKTASSSATIAEQETGDTVIGITLALLQNSIKDARLAFRNQAP